MHKRKVIALIGSIGLLSLAILGSKTPKLAQSMKSKLVSSASALNSDFSPAEERPPGDAAALKDASSSPSDKAKSETSPTITKEFLTREAGRMNRIDSNPKATVEILRQQAERMSATERALLVQTVTDPSEGENERALALHLLILSKSTSNEDFYKIASLNEPPSGNEYHDRFVSVVAIAALEQLQNRAGENPSLLGDIQRLSEQSKNKEVRAMAKEMLGAIKQGKLMTAEVQ